MAVRFIKNLKGRDSVTAAREDLQLLPLTDRRKNHRISLLMRILSDEGRHSALASAYEELVKTQPQRGVTTRASARGEPSSFHSSSTVHHNSFLPKTIRDLKLGTKPAAP